MRQGRGSFQATAVPLATFANAISQRLGRTIVDKTGLNGLYDLNLQWTPDPAGVVATAGPPPEGPPPADSPGPSIFTAIQEQLGLRLVSSKGSVEVIVIDSVQKPRTN
jgi:uncharacterized protein (TIGR03435 family)